LCIKDPQKRGIGGTPGPTDHSYDRTGCPLHTDLNYFYCPDIQPSNPTNLPLALKTTKNNAAFGAVLIFIEKLTIKLG
jgi:hypothetical protein